MTGFLRVLTGPEMAADHEKRLRELERRLGASQSDVGRGRRSAGANLATLNLHGSDTSIPAGAGTLVTWDAPNDIDSFNLGGAFTLTNGDQWLEAQGNYLVLATAYANWNDANIQDYIITLAGLEWAPTQDQRFRNSVTANPVTTSVTTIGRVNLGEPVTVSLSHDGAGAESVTDIFIGLTVLWTF